MKKLLLLILIGCLFLSLMGCVAQAGKNGITYEEVNVVIEDDLFSTMEVAVYKGVPYLSTEQFVLLAEARGFYVEHSSNGVSIEGTLYTPNELQLYSIELLPVSYIYGDNELRLYWIFNR